MPSLETETIPISQHTSKSRAPPTSKALTPPPQSQSAPSDPAHSTLTVASPHPWRNWMMTMMRARKIMIHHPSFKRGWTIMIHPSVKRIGVVMIRHHGCLLRRKEVVLSSTRNRFKAIVRSSIHLLRINVKRMINKTIRDHRLRRD